jgi:hypothetical protein
LGQRDKKGILYRDQKHLEQQNQSFAPVTNKAFANQARGLEEYRPEITRNGPQTQSAHTPSLQMIKEKPQSASAWQLAPIWMN